MPYNGSILEIIGEDLNTRLAHEIYPALCDFCRPWQWFWPSLSISIWGFSCPVRGAIDHFGRAARKVAGGDMTVRIELENRDEMGALSSEFNNMTEKMHQLIQIVSGTAGDVDLQAQRVNDTATATSGAVDKQLSETNQISEAMHQMVDTVQEVAESSQKASDAAIPCR